MIIFTSHSLLKLKQRKISKNLVIKTLKNPERISKSYSNREICYKRFGNLYLKVVYKKEDKNIIVITQYWTKEVISN